MKTEPKPSDRELLAGLVERVTYQNAENGFCVIRVKARGHRELITVVGHAAAISAGEWITAAGDWVNDRKQGHTARERRLPVLRKRRAHRTPFEHCRARCSCFTGAGEHRVLSQGRHVCAFRRSPSRHWPRRGRECCSARSTWLSSLSPETPILP